jgi:acyl transferase domain-containing protein
VLKEAKIKAIPLVVSHAFHSHLMDPIVADFEKEVAKIAFTPPKIPVISNVTQKELTFADLTPSYFGKHLRGTVHFYDDMIYLSEELGVDVFLELGPNPTLIGLGKQGIEKNTAVWASSAKKGSDDWEQIFNSLSLLFLSNIPFNWKQFYASYDLLKVNLPTYAWQKKKYWYSPVRMGQNSYSSTSESTLETDNQPLDIKYNDKNHGLTKETFYLIMHKEGNRILGLEKGSKLDDHRSMRDQGFDSMMSGEYLTALEKYLNTTLDISLLHLYTNLHDLHDYLSKKFLTNTQGGVLMNDIILGNILEEEEDNGNWHEIKETDGWLLKTFKKLDAKLPTISK